MSWWTQIVDDQPVTLTSEMLDRCIERALAPNGRRPFVSIGTRTAASDAISRHTALMNAAFNESAPVPVVPLSPVDTQKFEVWDGGVFCMDCDDTPHCEQVHTFEHRAAYTYTCPSCEREQTVDDMDLVERRVGRGDRLPRERFTNLNIS